MFKNAFISVIFIVLSAVSGLASAANNDAARALNVANKTINHAVYSQTVNKSNDIAKNTISQTKFQSAGKGDSAFSTGWLFVVALFWFVIMSNRRGV